MTKNEWIEECIQKRRARGYTEEELLEIRADMEDRYRDVSDDDFRKAHNERH